MKALSSVIERAWYHAVWWYRLLLIFFWPVSVVFSLLAAFRRRQCQSRQASLPVPVVIVGNINVGGTGKTPLLLALSAALSARGMRVGIISRGYGGKFDGKPHLVKPADTAVLVGDEPLLLAQRTECPVVIAHDRRAAALSLLEHAQVDIILSDDGLQHYALPRTVEIVVLDGTRGLGNGLCLPAGPLREPVSRLQDVDFVVVNGASQQVFHDEQLVTQLLPHVWIAVASGDEHPLSILQSGTAVHAIAGIGNPQRFFATLRALGLAVIEHAFPDHHPFSPDDLVFDDDCPVVMTEKDAIKCISFAGANCYALRVQMLLPDDWVSRLLVKVDENFRRKK